MSQPDFPARALDDGGRAVAAKFPGLGPDTGRKITRLVLDATAAARKEAATGPLPVSEVPWDDLDPEIVLAVHALADYGVDTFSSCQGGRGHPGYGGMPVILFHGGEAAGLWAVWLLETQGFKVQTLSRHWDLDHGLSRQPFWQVTLRTLEPVDPGPGTVRAPV